MNITENPTLVGDSIVFRDENGVFVYSQNQKKVAQIKNWNGDAYNKLKKIGFFMPLAETILSPKNQTFSNLMLLLGRGCCLGCRYCSVNAGITTELMNEQVADSAISFYLAQNPQDPRVALFGGGEPTLNIRTIKHIIGKYNKQVRWNLTTSGVMSPSFLEWLVDRGVEITFSIDGPPDIQNSLRPLKNGKPSSELVEKSINVYRERSNRPITVRATLTDDTIKQIHDILNYFDGLDVKTIHLEPLYSLGRAVPLIQNGVLNPVSPEKWKHTVVKSLAWARQHKKRIKIGELNYLLRPSATAYCGPINSRTLVVNHQGKITTCVEVVDEKNEEWDIFHIGSCFPRFYTDQQKLDHLASRISDNMVLCKDCFARYICRGGCPHRGWVATGNLFAPDPNHCNFIRAIIPILIREMTRR